MKKILLVTIIIFSFTVSVQAAPEGYLGQGKDQLVTALDAAIARVLDSNSSLAISPNTKQATNAGIRNTVGRCKTRPNVFVNSSA